MAGAEQAAEAAADDGKGKAGKAKNGAKDELTQAKSKAAEAAAEVSRLRSRSEQLYAQNQKLESELQAANERVEALTKERNQLKQKLEGKDDKGVPGAETLGKGDFAVKESVTFVGLDDDRINARRGDVLTTDSEHVEGLLKKLPKNSRVYTVGLSTIDELKAQGFLA